MRAFLTIDGLYKGTETKDGGVWMTLFYDPQAKQYVEVYTWFERSAVVSLDDIKDMKRKKVNAMLREYRQAGIRPPYVSISTELRATRGEVNSEPMETPITLREIESYMRERPDYLWLDFHPYTREGYPGDWSEWEPEQPDDITIIEFNR